MRIDTQAPLVSPEARLVNLESANFALPPDPSTVAGLSFWAEAVASLAMEGSAVTTWSDLSGNARHATSPGAAKSPLMRTTGGPLGQPWLDFSAAGQAAQLLTPAWARGAEGTAFVIARINSFTPATDSVLLSSADATNNLSLWQNSGTNNGYLFAYNGNPVQIVGVKQITSQWALFEMVWSNSSVGNLRINGDPTWNATGNTGTGTGSGLAIGNRGTLGSTVAWRGGIAAIATYDSVLSDPNRAIIRSYFHKKYLGVRQVMADGDSITEASPLLPDDWPTVAAGQMTRPTYIVNSGTGGDRLAYLITNGSAQIDTKWNPDAVQKIVVLFAGTNDWIDLGDSDDILLGKMVTYCKARRAATPGIKIIVATLLPRLTKDFGMLNARIRTNYVGFADGIADLAADPIMGNQANIVSPWTYYQADGVHPTALGRSLIATIFAASINALAPSSDVAARTLSAALATEAAARLAAQSALASIKQPPQLPAWDTGLNSGTLTGAAFSAVFNSGGGILRINGSRPLAETFGEVFAFTDSGGNAVGPTVFDTTGALQVRIRNAANGDVVQYNLATRSTPAFDLVIEWSTSAANDRHAVWLDGVLQTAASDSGVMATTQNQLRWGCTNLTINHLAYWKARLGTPILEGTLASRPLSGLGLPTIKTTSTTFSGLPSAAAAGNGARGYITDATLAYTGANQGSAAVGGGSNHTPVIVLNGAWVIGG